MANSILGRKRDLCYFLFFLTHIPIMLVQDLSGLYPQSVQSQFPFLASLRSWYNATYRDPLFINPPAWFGLYLWMEAILHLPTSIWAISALISDDPKVPLVFLVFATHTVITTATCVAEIFGRSEVLADEKKTLASLYLPYIGLALLMFADMYGRLSGKLVGQGPNKKKTT